MDDDRLRYGRCWWCGEPDSLFRLEGARLAGSEPLGLPSSIVTPQDADGFRVCPGCALLFGTLRIRHDAELAHAGILRGFVAREEISEAEIQRAVRSMRRRDARNVRDAFRKVLEEGPNAEGV